MICFQSYSRVHSIEAASMAIYHPKTNHPVINILPSNLVRDAFKNGLQMQKTMDCSGFMTLMSPMCALFSY